MYRVHWKPMEHSCFPLCLKPLQLINVKRNCIILTPLSYDKTMSDAGYFVIDGIGSMISSRTKTESFKRWGSQSLSFGVFSGLLETRGYKTVEPSIFQRYMCNYNYIYYFFIFGVCIYIYINNILCDFARTIFPLFLQLLEQWTFATVGSIQFIFINLNEIIGFFFLYFHSVLSSSSHHLMTYLKPRGNRRSYWPSLLLKQKSTWLPMATFLCQRETPAYKAPEVTCMRKHMKSISV